MIEKLVDVLGATGSVIHTYPVTLISTDDADFLAKGLEAAAHGQLVPDEELSMLSARIHASRGGALAPYGDHVSADSQTRTGLAQEVRERAYRLWEQEGRQEGRSDEHWHRAMAEHLRERAYNLWELQGSREGRAGENHKQVRDFEAS
jgi:hypothetical protein